MIEKKTDQTEVVSLLGDLFSKVFLELTRLNKNE